MRGVMENLAKGAAVALALGTGGGVGGALPGGVGRAGPGVGGGQRQRRGVALPDVRRAGAEGDRRLRRQRHGARAGRAHAASRAARWCRAPAGTAARRRGRTIPGTRCTRRCRGSRPGTTRTGCCRAAGISRAGFPYNFRRWGGYGGSNVVVRAAGICEHQRRLTAGRSAAPAREPRRRRQEGRREQGHQERHDRHRRPDVEGGRAGRGRDDHGDRRGAEGRRGDRRHRRLRHAGRDRPAYPSRDAVHGHDGGGDLRERHASRRLRAARRCWSTSCCRGRTGACSTALDEWDRKSEPQICVDIGYHMAITGWNEQIWREMDAVVKRGVNTFKHFMAYKGALMVEDDEMYASFRRCAELGALPLVHAENGDIVAELQKKYMDEGLTGPEGACLFAAAGGRGRGGEPGDHDRRRGRGAALHRACVLRAGARGDPAGAAEGDAGLRRAADPAPDARRDASISTRTGTMRRGG